MTPDEITKFVSDKIGELKEMVYIDKSSPRKLNDFIENIIWKLKDIKGDMNLEIALERLHNNLLKISHPLKGTYGDEKRAYFFNEAKSNCLTDLEHYHFLITYKPEDTKP